MSDDQHSWRLVGASVVGTSHLKAGLPCQDAFRYALWPDGVVIAVSDGAGSAKKAAEGSALAVEAAIDSLLDALIEGEGEPSTNEAWQGVVRRAFGAARAALMQHALSKNGSIREYDATLMLLILTERYTVGGLIGDCAAVMLDKAGQLATVCRPQMGEYANMTNFLTQPGALQLLDVQIYVKPVQAVAVFSDGLSRLALNLAQSKPYAPFFKPLFAFTAAIEDEQEAQTQLETFLNSKRINTHTNDDKTLVLGCRVSGE